MFAHDLLLSKEAASRILGCTDQDCGKSVGCLAAQHSSQAFKSGEVHAGRESCAHGDQDNPDQPQANAHLIPGATPRSERQRQGRPVSPRPLLGYDTEVAGLPCTVSVPNLITDRVAGLGLRCAALNVRRLMYQPLIWCVHPSDHAGSLDPALNLQDLQSAADALIDSMWRNAQFDRDLFRGKVLVYEQ
jgi:hypothetical protein